MSVPVWLTILSDQLPVFGLVGLYPTNYLMGRRPLPTRSEKLSSTIPRRAHAVLATVSSSYSPHRGRLPTCYSPMRHCVLRHRSTCMC